MTDLEHTMSQYAFNEADQLRETRLRDTLELQNCYLAIGGLSNKVKELEGQIKTLLKTIEFSAETMEGVIPEEDCRCHISPPCNDCVDYAGAREALKMMKGHIKERQ